MLLLTIAHQGEAKEFIKRKHTQAVDFHFPGVYRDDKEILLITGEGIQLTTLRMTALCTYFSNKIDRVINMGIAGSLDSSLQLNQIYGIRSVHHEYHGEQGYPSFQCMETHSRFDCVSATKRVDNDIYAQSLEKIAPIVDRELWAIGSVCNQFNLPFKSYKLISDSAGKSTNDQQVKSRAISFSKHLFDFYKNLSLSKAEWNSTD